MGTNIQDDNMYNAIQANRVTRRHNMYLYYSVYAGYSFKVSRTNVENVCDISFVIVTGEI